MLKRTKQIITAILATATIASSAIPVFASTYSDVSDSHWAAILTKSPDLELSVATKMEHFALIM